MKVQHQSTFANSFAAQPSLKMESSIHTRFHLKISTEYLVTHASMYGNRLLSDTVMEQKATTHKQEHNSFAGVCFGSSIVLQHCMLVC